MSKEFERQELLVGENFWKTLPSQLFSAVLHVNNLCRGYRS